MAQVIHEKRNSTCPGIDTIAGGVIAIPKDGSLDINYIYHVQQASL